MEIPRKPPGREDQQYPFDEDLLLWLIRRFGKTFILLTPEDWEMARRLRDRERSA